MEWMQAVRNRARKREREKESARSNEGWRTHDGRSVSSETANRSSRLAWAAAAEEWERILPHTRAHTHPDRSRAAHTRQGSADTRWQWYTWDRKSVWKLYSTHRRHRDICGLISLGKVEYFPFLCIIPNVFCVVWERVSYLKEVVVHQPTRESE